MIMYKNNNVLVNAHVKDMVGLRVRSLGFRASVWIMTKEFTLQISYKEVMIIS